jgi:hypothetical protein
LGELVKEIFTLSPSRKIMVSVCAGCAGSTAADVEAFSFGDVAQPLNANTAAKISPQKAIVRCGNNRLKLLLRFIFIGFFVVLPKK